MRRAGWLAAAVLVPRLVVFFVNQNLGGDAIARTLLAHRWLESPHVLASFADGGRQFGPLHLYLLSLAEWLWRAPEHAGRVVSLVVGAATAWPLFVFTARRFGEQAAELAVLAFACWGFHVQASTTAGSEALNLLLVMGVVACFDVATSQRRAWWGAVVLLNLACATRFDSWLLVPFLALVELWRTRRLGAAIAFGAASSVYAVTRLVGDFSAMGDALFSIRYIDQYHRAWWEAEAATWGASSYRVACALFWPGAALVMLTPALAVPGFVALRRAWRERPEVRWVIAFVAFSSAIYGLRGALGSFVPLARFTAKEVLLFLPFVGWGLQRFAGPLLALAVAWMIGLGVYCFEPDSGPAATLRPIAPTSRLEEPLRSTAQWLRENAAPQGGLLVVDVDPRGFDDLAVSFFSGFPLDDQLRVRHEKFEVLLGGRVPRWLVRFEEGGETVEFRGRTYARQRAGVYQLR